MRLSFPPLKYWLACAVMCVCAAAQTPALVPAVYPAATFAAGTTSYGAVSCPAGSVCLAAGTVNNGAGVSADAAGNLYLPSTAAGQVLRWEAATGVVSAYASGLTQPVATATDAQGGVYVAEWGGGLGGGEVAYVPAGGGSPVSVASGAVAQSGDHPIALATASQGRLYVLTAEGPLYVCSATDSNPAHDTCATASTPALSQPMALAIDAQGALYIANYGQNSVIKLTPSVDDNFGPGHVTSTTVYSAANSKPTGVAVDGAGNVYILASGLGTVAEVTASGASSVVAGLGSWSIASANSLKLNPTATPGPASEVSLAMPTSPVGSALPAAPSALSFAGSLGLILLPQSSGQILAMTTPDGLMFPNTGVGSSSVRPVFAQNVAAASRGGISMQLSATFLTNLLPSSSAFSYPGTAFLLGSSTIANGSSSTGNVCTNGQALIAKSGNATKNYFCEIDIQFNPTAVGQRGALLTMANTTSTTPTLAVTGVGAAAIPAAVGGSASALAGAADLTVAASTVDPSGHLWLYDADSTSSYGFDEIVGGARALRIGAAAGVKAIAFDPYGNLYAAGSGLSKASITVASDGTVSYGALQAVALPVPYTSDSFSGLAAEASGNLYLADQSICTVIELSGGLATPVAGTGACSAAGATAGLATTVPLGAHLSLAVDASGALDIGDADNGVLRQVSGGWLSTVSLATAVTPNAIATDAAGNIYVADASASQIDFVSNPALSAAPAQAVVASGLGATPTTVAVTGSATSATVSFGSTAAGLKTVDTALGGAVAFDAAPANPDAPGYLQNVTLANLGNLSLTLTSATASPAAPFTATLPSASAGVCSNTLVLAAGAACAAPVYFDPLSAGDFAANLSYSTSAGLIPVAASGTAQAAVATPAQLAFSVEPPSSVTAGDAFSVSVAVEDASGNVLTSDSGTVVMLTPSGPGAVAGTLAASDVNGVATFSGLSAITAGTYSFQASASPLTPATSSNLTVNPAAAANLKIVSGNGQLVTVMGAYAPLVTQVTDQYGNPVPNAQVYYSAADAAGVPSGTFGSPTSPIIAITDGQGQATESLTANGVVGGFTVTATAGSLSASFLETNLAGPAATLQVALPALVRPGVATPAIVSAIDAYGNPTTDSAQVTLTSSDAAAALPGAGPLGVFSVSFHTFGGQTLTATDANGRTGLASTTVLATSISVPSEPVGTSTPTPVAVTFGFTTPQTVASVKVVTQGLTGRDFTDAGAGSCVGSFTVGQTCNVEVTFTPSAPGVRDGAVLLYDASGNLLQTVYLAGIGEGAAVGFQNASSDAIAFTQAPAGSPVFGVAADVARNLYLANGSQIWKQAVDTTQTLVLAAGSYAPQALALDGAGNLFFTDQDSGGVFEIPVAGGAPQPVTLPAGLTARAVAVDGEGNVYVGGTAAGNGGPIAVKLTTGTWASTTLLSQQASYPEVDGIAVGPTGDVYFTTGANLYRLYPANDNYTVQLNLQAVTNPTGVAVDAGGNVYVANTSGNTVAVLSGDGGTQWTLGTVAGAYGLAVDGGGNVFAGTTAGGVATVQWFALQSPGTLQFPQTEVNATSANVNLGVLNIGNENLTLNLAYDPQFPSEGGTYDGRGLFPGSGAAFYLAFAPQAAGAPVLGNLTVIDNSVMSPGNVMPLSGNAVLRSQTISFTLASNTATFGDAPVSLSATASSGLPVSFSVVSGPGTIAGSTLTITGAGSIVIAANQPGNGEYAAASEVDQTLVVAKTNDTVNFAAVAAQTWPVSGPIALSATGTSTGAITYKVVSGPATVTASALTITGAGTVVVEADQAADANYEAGTAQQTITVNKGVDAVNFAAVPAQTWPVISAITLSATGHGTGVITYKVLSGPATVTGSTLTITGAGAVVVEADQAADANYEAASAQQTVTVAKGSDTLNFAAVGNTTWPVPGPVVLSATGTSTGAITYKVVSGPATVTGSTLTITGAGTVVVEADQAADANYEAASAQQTVTVAKGSDTLNFAAVGNTTWPVPGPIALSATGTSTGAITYKVVSGPATVSGSTLTITGAGTVVVEADQAADANYEARSTTIQFNVAPGAQAINFTLPASGTVGQLIPLVATGGASGNPVTFTVTGPGQIQGSQLALAGAGVVTVTAAQAGSANYAAATPVSRSVTVILASQAITFPAIGGQLYNGQPVVVTLNAASSAGLPVTYTVSGPATVSGNQLTITGPGQVTVMANANGNGQYAAAAPVTQSVNVNLGLGWGLYATANTCGAIQLNGNVAVDSYDSALGVYPAGLDRSLGGIGTNGNAQLTGSVQVYGALFDPNGNTTGDCDQGRTQIYSLELTGHASVSQGIKTLPQALTFPLPAAPASVPTSNQSLSNSCGNVSGCTAVSKRELALTPGNYGNLSISGNVTVDLSAGTYNLNSLTLAGNSALQVTGGPVVLNLKGAGTSTVLSVAGNGLENATAPANLMIVYAGSGAMRLTGGDDAAAVLYAPAADVTVSGNAVLAGTIIAHTINVNGNVNIHYDRELAKVAVPGDASNSQPQAPPPTVLTVTANDATCVYGACGNVPGPSDYTVTGFVNGDTAQTALSGAPALNAAGGSAPDAGTYAITVARGTLTAVGNYTFNFVPGTLTVTKAVLTVTADRERRAVNANNPQLSYTIAGFVNGDTAAVVSGTPEVTTAAVKSSAAGLYPIAISQGTLSAANYTFTFVNGMLTIYNPSNPNDPHCDGRGHYRDNPDWDSQHWTGDQKSYDRWCGPSDTHHEAGELDGGHDSGHAYSDNDHHEASNNGSRDRHDDHDGGWQGPSGCSYSLQAFRPATLSQVWNGGRGYSR